MGRPGRKRKAERGKRKDNQQVDFKNMNGVVPGEVMASVIHQQERESWGRK